jgi:transcriptional repressor NrdR
MRCPYCQMDNDSVRDSRVVEDGKSIRRRRVCNHCKRRFTTYERVEAALLVIKKDGARESFMREKIERGLERSCWKRPVSAETIRLMAENIENQIQEEFDLEVPSREIGELAMKQLAEIDQVAFVRFASVYREFKDASDFVEELRPMLHRKGRTNHLPANDE